MLDRLSEYYPQYEVVIGEPPPGPWVKALAIADVLQRTTSETLILHDADVWCDGLGDAVKQVHNGAPWAVPHRRVKRLNRKSTDRVLAGEPPDRLQLEEPSYVGALTGGITVLRRDVFLDVPMDPRFQGWGAEDRCWSMALELLVGQPWRGSINLFHLAHPPQPRADRNHGSPETEALRKRYIAARQFPDRMRELLDEIGDAWPSTPSPNSPT